MINLKKKLKKITYKYIYKNKTELEPCFFLNSVFLFTYISIFLTMASNQEESFLLEDGNHPGMTNTETAPVFIEGTPRREVLLRLPNLTDMHTGTTIDQSFAGGDMPVSSNISFANLTTNHNNTINYSNPSSYAHAPSLQGPMYGYLPNNPCWSTTNLGQNTRVLGGGMANMASNTIPSVSTATRCSILGASENPYLSCNDRQTSQNSREIAYPNTNPTQLRHLYNVGGSQETQYNKHLKPGTYDGSGSWADYLIQFNIIADHYHWDDHNRALHLAVNLRGTAQSVLSDLSQEQRASYASLAYA